MEFVLRQNLVLECTLGRTPSFSAVIDVFILVFGRLFVVLLVASLLLLFPWCFQIVETSTIVVHIVRAPLKKPFELTGLGGFLMARFRRGVSTAKVFPVDQGYIPVAGQEREYTPTPPLPQFPQQTGVTDAKR
jgi:hypothetical protein